MHAGAGRVEPPASERKNVPGPTVQAGLTHTSTLSGVAGDWAAAGQEIAEFSRVLVYYFVETSHGNPARVDRRKLRAGDTINATPARQKTAIFCTALSRQQRHCGWQRSLKLPITCGATAKVQSWLDTCGGV